MGKRRERVAQPLRAGGWDFQYADSSAAAGWGKLCPAAPENARVAWDRITTDPSRRDVRQHALRGKLGLRVVNHQPREQWQYEVAGAGRLWYCIEGDRRTVWLTATATGHPKVTE